MPRKATVAFGVALGIWLFTTPIGGWCFNGDPGAIPKPPVEPAATTTDLTLDEALNRTLSLNPTLEKYSRETRAREFGILQAGALPNPEVSVEVENFAGTGEFSGTGSAETTVTFSQEIELGGKRKHRLDITHSDREVAEREYDIARLEVMAATKNRFRKVLAAQARLALAKEQHELARKIFRAVEDRIAAGKTPAIERVRVQALVAEIRLRLEKSKNALRVARQILATGWGSDVVDFSTVRGNLERTGAIPEWPELVAALDQSPAVALQRSRSRKADGILGLERADRVPDLTFSLGARDNRETGDHALVAGIAFPLPVFNRNQGAIAAAEMRRSKTESAVGASLLEVRANLAGALEQLLSAQLEISTLREEILPAARRTFDAIDYGYQAGKFGFLEVLEAERSLFEAQSRYLDALTDHHRAITEIERLLGRNISELSLTDHTVKANEVHHE